MGEDEEDHGALLYRERQRRKEVVAAARGAKKN